uniref:Integrase catalytic domain-containing protein n=1 Tax=Strongyloides venezuelensis TaxID=75913 RepID=A0A0K0FBE0_STRVS
MKAPLCVNLQTKLEILKSKSLQELRELCPYKSLTKDFITIIMLDEYSQHDRHKEVTDLVLGLTTNTVLSTSNPKYQQMDNATITETPIFNSKSMSFTKWTSLLETEFTIKNVTTDAAKLAWLQVKLRIDNLQLLPTVVNTNTYEKYKQIDQSKFPVELSEQELLVQYGSYRVNLTKDELKDLQAMTLKTFRDRPEATQVSEMCSKLMLAAITDLQRYIIESAKSLLLSQAMEQISKTVPDKFKPISHDRYKFCNFPGHSEEQCQRKAAGLDKKNYFVTAQEEKNTETLHSHSLILDNSPAIDDGTLSPGEFNDAYLNTVNNINDEIESKNGLPVTNMELASSVCFINQAKVLVDVGANVNILNTLTAKKLQIFDTTVKTKILSCESNLETYQINASFSITYKEKIITPKGTTVTKGIPYDLIMNIQTCGLLGISIDTANKNITINDPFIIEILRLYPEVVVSESNPLGKCTLTAPLLMLRDLKMPKLIRYGVPPSLIPKVQKEIDEMINLDVCKLNYKTKYIVPIRVVNKSLKQLRICQDFRK